MAKSFTYATALDRAGRVSVDDGPPAEVPAEWKPEHLVLAGLIRCTLTSLRYHARRLGIDDVAASASARGRVTKRDEDERYAFVEIDCDFDVELDGSTPPADVAELVARAERDCFVGASLTPPPRYRWIVNGEDVASAG